MTAATRLRLVGRRPYLGRVLRRLLVLSLLLTACADDRDRSSDGLQGPYGEVLDAVCGVIDRCRDRIYPIAYRSRSECKQILKFTFTCDLDDIEIGDQRTFRLTERVPEVTEEQAEACAAFLEQVSCDTFDLGQERGSTPCDGLIVADDSDGGGGSSGGAPVGAACGETECAAGGYCTGGGFNQDALAYDCPVCAAIPGKGEDCSGSGQCLDGHWCDWEMEPATCVPLAAAGEACMNSSSCRSEFCNPGTMLCDDGGEEDDPCGAPEDCRPGLFCGAGNCTPLRRNGESCDGEGQCVSTECDLATGTCGLADGAECSAGRDCASERCIETICTPKLADGMPCEGAADCLSDYCDYSTSICQAHCYTDDECGPEEFCHWRAETCIPKKEDGGYCEDDEECLSNWCTFDEVCATPPELGDACTRSQDCYPLGWCENGVCAERKAPGQSCTALDSCKEPFICIEGKCEIIQLECAPAPAGELCTFFRVCDENAYCQIPSFVCQPRKGEGESCSGDVCGPGLFCEPSTNTCERRVGEGEECTSTGQCVDGLFCAGGVCSSGPEGRPCDEYDAPCPEGLFCSRDDTCQSPGGTDADCDSDLQCQEGFFCDFGYGCQPRPGLGGECWTNIPCEDPYYCDIDTRSCVRDAQEGETCETTPLGIECASDLYCDYDPELSMSVCKARVGAGQPCDDDEACLSGACQYVEGEYICLASRECVGP